MNSFGTSFILSDYGGSYDTHIGGTVTGCPAGVKIDLKFIQRELSRRAPSSHPHSTQRKETDKVEFLSGIENGKTTGAQIEFKIPNRDIQPDISMYHILKPSHASYTYKMKYGITDNRGIGRASARQTVCRVVGGSIAKLFLKQFGIEINANYRDAACHASTGNTGDTHGALVHCTIKNLPAGLGEPVYDKFDARLAYAILSINACKGFEMGKGFAAALMLGSEYNDTQNPGFSFKTNNDGGVQAGITNGQEVCFRVAFKPIPTLQMEQQTIDFEGNSVTCTGNNRNDICVVPRVLPVVEAMAALVIADFLVQLK
ncbi:MAG: chorismate synthase [Bacteroidales bacterium]|jgi:chorismate synthase|nr:chorismate synthase [Bacteroidales bacterium]